MFQCWTRSAYKHRRHPVKLTPQRILEWSIWRSLDSIFLFWSFLRIQDSQGVIADGWGEQRVHWSDMQARATALQNKQNLVGFRSCGAAIQNLQVCSINFGRACLNSSTSLHDAWPCFVLFSRAMYYKFRQSKSYFCILDPYCNICGLFYK